MEYVFKDMHGCLKYIDLNISLWNQVKHLSNVFLVWPILKGNDGTSLKQRN